MGKGTPLWKALLLEHRIPWRYKNKISLVKLSWLLELKLRNIFSNKIKVGFGPIETGEYTLGTRKWCIDPIVNYINRHSKKYVCDIFFDNEDLSKFDNIIIVKNFDNINKKTIQQLKKNRTIFIYNTVDNPAGCKKSYYKNISFIKSIDGILISNPLQGKDIQKYNSNFRLIETPIINHQYKKNYRKKGLIKILWEGINVNMIFMNKLNPIIKKLAKNYDINMIYHSNIHTKDEGIIKYVEWKLSNWEKMFVDSDIAIVIKPLNNKYQQRKPSAKIIAHMAAGLPVICTPSAADKLAIRHGKTGYFAYTDKDWYKYLKMLIESPELREKIGKAARKYALENFNTEKIGQKYIDFFDELITTKTN